MKLSKVKEILEELQEQVENAIENNGEDYEVKEKQNTYWCKGKYLSLPSVGFIDFGDLEKDEWDDEEDEW